MPNNEVSIREWTKHIATSQRNYLDDEVIFEVDCSDQNIYAALQDQFDKIQNVINYSQKVIRSIPFIKGKRYELSMSLVRVKYNFIGFHPKGIKFSFDVQNVVTAFIGEDLYKDKLTSLREAVQNAIDSCRYKSKVLKEVYDPHIRIILNENFIAIEDNGAGMDEFIIENFFGRLASSFYEQEKIKSQFEAIGQFGVGVFSYFLLSEYIDIETKTATSHALKFRFDKDPKSYFHFYDRTERNTPGTTITMYLKEEVTGKLGDKYVIDYLRDTFKHIEIPLELDVYGNKSSIDYKPFEIDAEKEIGERLKLQHKKFAKDLEIKVIKIDDEEVEGVCGLIIEKDYVKTFNMFNNLFDSDTFLSVSRHQTTSQIAVSQKGVFVNDYSSPWLNFLIGDINLKRKIKINIDRNEFTNEHDIFDYIYRFEKKILLELFDTLEKKFRNDEERLNITNKFFQNYSNFSSNGGIPYDEELISKLSKHLYVKAYFKDYHNLIFSIEELTSQTKEFILTSNRENYEEISNHFNKPVVLALGDQYDGPYDELNKLFFLLKYGFYIDYQDNRGYQTFKLGHDSDKYYDDVRKINQILDHPYHQMAKGKSNKIFISLWSNKAEFAQEYYEDEFFVNYNHPFIQFVISNLKTIASNNIYRRLVKSAFQYMTELNNSRSFDKDSLKKLNEIIKPLNEISRIDNFSSADFLFKDLGES